MPRRRPGRTSWLDLFYLVVLVGALAGGSLWLDRKGVAVRGQVESKHERIRVVREPRGSWDRSYEVAVGFGMPDGGKGQATVSMPRERYDALQVGDTIAVRYLPAAPFLARTADRSTASVAREMTGKLLASSLLVWLFGGIAAMWLAARMGTIPVVAAGAVWAAAAFPLLFGPAPPVTGRGGPGTARVAGITTVSKSPSASSHRSRRGWGDSQRRLAVPYQVVELAVPVAGRPDTVLAVDVVDSGSVAGLAPGATVPVRLDPAAPREATLAAGTRQFAEKNRYHMVIPVVGFALLGTLAGLTYRWNRRRHRDAPPDGAATLRP